MANSATKHARESNHWDRALNKDFVKRLPVMVQSHPYRFDALRGLIQGFEYEHKQLIKLYQISCSENRKLRAENKRLRASLDKLRAKRKKA